MLEADWICAVDVQRLLKPEDKMPDAYKAMKSRIPSTIAVVRPIECFKGGTTKDFYVFWPGGTSKDDHGKVTRVTVPGTPNLSAGQKAVLYLMRESADDSLFSVHSFINGVANIRWDEAQKEYVFESARLPSVSSSNAHFSSAEARNLKTFRFKVQQVLSTPKTR